VAPPAGRPPGPGNGVAAIASRSLKAPRPAVAITSAISWGRASTWRREAISGNHPAQRACSLIWDATALPAPAGHANHGSTPTRHNLFRRPRTVGNGLPWNSLSPRSDTPALPAGLSQVPGSRCAASSPFCFALLIIASPPWRTPNIAGLTPCAETPRFQGARQ